MQLDLMLVFERFADDRAALLYPINILRNYARLQVGKELRTAVSGHLSQIGAPPAHPALSDSVPVMFRADTVLSIPRPCGRRGLP